MPPNPEALATLRDIHLPAAPGWWPPAPGWWVLAGLLLLLGWLAYRVQCRFRRRRARRATIADLRALPLTSAEHAALLQRMSRLIRQLALTEYGRRRVARLHGVEWLRFLEHCGNFQGAFTRGIGRHLAARPYQHPAAAALSAADLESLRQLLVRWCLTFKPAAPTRASYRR